MTKLSETTNNPEKPKFSFYEGFDGNYHKIAEIKDLIPQFKAFYYAEKRKDLSRSAIKIINDFNRQITPFTFFPWEKQYRLWRKKWDAELLAEVGYLQQQREVRQLVKLQDEQNAVIVPDEYTLERGAQTLAGELLNDALTHKKALSEERLGKPNLYSGVDFETALNEVFGFVKNPYNIWANGIFEDKRLVLRMVFSQHLVYNRKSGFETTAFSLPITLFGTSLDDKSHLVVFV